MRTVFRRLLCAALALSAPAFGAELTGKIIADHTNGPVASADVRLHQPGARRLVADLETDSEGKFQTSDLPPGEYRAVISKPGYSVASVTIQIKPEEPARLTVRLIRSASFSGLVADAAGQPVRGATVFAIARSSTNPFLPLLNGQPGNSTKVDERGRFRLYNIPPGEFAIAVSYGSSALAVGSTGHAPPPTAVGTGLVMYPSNARPEFFQISGGEEISNINFTISPTALSSVSGRIEGVAPHSTYWLILTPIDQPRLSIAVQPATDDGSFQLTGIPPGSYHLLTHGPITGRTSGAGIIGPATKFARTRVDLAGQPVSGITLSPHPGVGGIVKVQIEPGAESDCPASLRVFLTPIEDWAAQLSKDVTATLEGAVVGNLAPARYNLTVMQPKDNCHQIGAAILDLTVSDPVPGVLRMGASGSIRGRLSGGASQGTVVTLMSEAASNAKPVVLAKPDAEGRFSFPSLAPGKYLIGLGRDSADSQSRWLDRGSALRQVEVSTGKATEVELAPLGAKP